MIKKLDDVVMDRLVVESGYYLMKEKLVRLHFIGEVVLIIIGTLIWGFGDLLGKFF